MSSDGRARHPTACSQVRPRLGSLLFLGPNLDPTSRASLPGSKLSATAFILPDQRVNLHQSQRVAHHAQWVGD